MKLSFDVPDKYGEDLQNTLQTVIKETLKMLKDADKVPDFGEEYYYIDINGVVEWEKWEGSDLEKEMLVFDNIYKTKEEAEFTLEQLKVLRELKELADDDQEWNGNNSHLHYYLAYSYHDNKIETDWNNSCCKGTFYFKSVESAEAAIKQIGKDRLKKYYFLVPEDKI